MKTLKQQKLSENLKNKSLIFVLSIILLGNVPGGFNQDEAFAGYEAFCC